MDELLKLNEFRVGCHIGNTFFSVLEYTDDVSLLCFSLASLRVMISIANQFGIQLYVIPNTPKFQLLVYLNYNYKIQDLEQNVTFVRALLYANRLGNFTGPKLWDHVIIKIAIHYQIQIIQDELFATIWLFILGFVWPLW